MQTAIEQSENYSGAEFLKATAGRETNSVLNRKHRSMMQLSVMSDGKYLSKASATQKGTALIKTWFNNIFKIA